MFQGVIEYNPPRLSKNPHLFYPGEQHLVQSLEVISGGSLQVFIENTRLAIKVICKDNPIYIEQSEGSYCISPGMAIMLYNNRKYYRAVNNSENPVFVYAKYARLIDADEDAADADEDADEAADEDEDADADANADADEDENADADANADEDEDADEDADENADEDADEDVDKDADEDEDADEDADKKKILLTKQQYIIEKYTELAILNGDAKIIFSENDIEFILINDNGITFSNSIICGGANSYVKLLKKGDKLTTFSENIKIYAKNALLKIISGNIRKSTF